LVKEVSKKIHHAPPEGVEAKKSIASRRPKKRAKLKRHNQFCRNKKKCKEKN
jgi:hypothetical protein